MPRYKIKRSFEEEEEFQRQRHKRKADNQRQRNEIIKIRNNSNPTISHVHGTICSNHVINLSNKISGGSSTNVTTVCHQHAEYQSCYRSHNRKQPQLNINNTMSINNIVEYYIGSMDVFCTHCNVKHFAAEKISNMGN